MHQTGIAAGFARNLSTHDLLDDDGQDDREEREPDENGTGLLGIRPTAVGTLQKETRIIYTA